MRNIDLPAKVIEGEVAVASGLGAWPYNGGDGDPFWEGGSNPVDYRWRIVLNITPQSHSSYRTRQPKIFNGYDIKIGDYVADRDTGVCVKIVSIEAKTETSVTCIVEDFLRYNTFRFYGGTGYGLFTIPAQVVVFSLNEESLPVVDPIPPSGVGSAFFPNVMSRFQNIEQNANFLLSKTNHDFEVDDLISVDPNTNTFVKTSSSYPFIVGTVSVSNIGPNEFMVNTIQKVLDNLSFLIGEVGDVLYAHPTIPGELSTTGQHPVMIKLRENTQSFVAGSVKNPSTQPGSTFRINGHAITLLEGTSEEFVNLVNESTPIHGVVASAVSESSIAETVPADCVNGEPAFLSNEASATINGVLVNFTTTEEGMKTYAAAYVLEQDMAADINAANIQGIVAYAEKNKLIIKNTTGGDITIVNMTTDNSGNQFAGPASASGLPTYTAAVSGQRINLTAVDARAIDLFDDNSTATADFGLYSVENGQKAAALYIEQGIRQAATYVVATITARDAINAMFGDQCFVQDKGNGEWGHYIRTLDNIWVKVADKDSAETDAQTVEVEIDHTTDITDVIYTVSGGSRVTFVTVTVTEQFNGLNPLISVGDTDDANRLMTNNQNDLKSLGTYSTTPSYIYSGSSDVDITFTFDAANSTTGKAVIAISYT